MHVQNDVLGLVTQLGWKENLLTKETIFHIKNHASGAAVPFSCISMHGGQKWDLLAFRNNVQI